MEWVESRRSIGVVPDTMVEKILQEDACLEALRDVVAQVRNVS